MAELLHVIYDVEHGGGGALPAPPGLGAATAGSGGGGDGFVEYSKEEVEKFTQVVGNETPKRFGTEAIKCHGPILRGKIVTIEAESAAVAAKFVKYVLGGQVEGVLAQAAGKTKISETPATNKEAGEKPITTVKTTGYEATAAT